jgi:hypothetical protein
MRRTHEMPLMARRGWRIRPALVGALLMVPLPSALAGIFWSTNEQAAAQQSQHNGAPLMVWLGYHRSNCCDENNALDRIEDEQRRAFNDPTVLAAARDFVALRVDLGDKGSHFKTFGAPFDLVFVSPAGQRLASLSAADARSPERVLRGMRTALDEYRKRIYERDVRPTITSGSAAPAAAKTALVQLRKSPVRGADKDVLTLLKRKDLDAGVEAEAIAALGALSTAPAVKELIRRAPDDERAAVALGTCNPEALEPLLSHLDNRNKPEFLIVYRAVTRAGKIESPKPDKFWDGPNERVKTNEIDRVKTAARAAAQKWRDRNALDR